MPPVVHHGTVKANNNSLGNLNHCRQFVDFSVVLARTCNYVRGHVAIITETESTYVMIESTLQFDDVEDVPGLLPLLRVVQRSRMLSRERSGRQPGNEAILQVLYAYSVSLQNHSSKHWQTCDCPVLWQPHCRRQIWPVNVVTILPHIMEINQ